MMIKNVILPHRIKQYRSVPHYALSFNLLQYIVILQYFCVIGEFSCMKFSCNNVRWHIQSSQSYFGLTNILVSWDLQLLAVKIVKLIRCN